MNQVNNITEPPFTPTPFTCYYQTLYYNNRCEFCPVVSFALCEHNGYKTKELKSHFEQEIEVQKELEELDKAVKKTNNSKKSNTSNNKKGRRKKK